MLIFYFVWVVLYENFKVDGCQGTQCFFFHQMSIWLMVGWFQGNSVSTTKYNVLTFFPKGLYEQVTYVISRECLILLFTLGILLSPLVCFLFSQLLVPLIHFKWLKSNIHYPYNWISLFKLCLKVKPPMLRGWGLNWYPAECESSEAKIN